MPVGYTPRRDHRAAKLPTQSQLPELESALFGFDYRLDATLLPGIVGNGVRNVTLSYTPFLASSQTVIWLSP
jgi:hypothetical protein